MPKITSNLWFDTQAKAAAELYAATFPDTEILSSSTMSDTPSGDVDVINLRIMDHEFTLMSAGPAFVINPSISYAIACETKEMVDELWNKLADGGTPMMELGSYPFSERYGWIRDKFGMSWQLMFAGNQPIRQRVTPTLMFVGEVCGQTEEAIKMYTSVFRNSAIDHIIKYGENAAPNKPEYVMHAAFQLEGQLFAAMDSSLDHDFTFNEAISLMVNCDTQEEIDYYWEKLSAVPEAEQCGWLKDKFGVSWQITPTIMGEMFTGEDLEAEERVKNAFMPMKKLDLAAIKAAYEGN